MGKFHSSLPVEAKLSIGEESSPALDLPVRVVEKVFGLFAFGWSKVEVRDLVSLVVKEDLVVTIDESAEFAVVEMLPPDWVVLDVVFFCFQCLLNVIFVVLFV